jgi:hypothetical protein
MVFENEEEIHFHCNIFYCILFSLQNSPTHLTVKIYRLSVNYQNRRLRQNRYSYDSSHSWLISRGTSIKSDWIKLVLWFYTETSNFNLMSVKTYTLKFSIEMSFRSFASCNIFYCILFSLQNSPTHLTVKIYRLSVISTALYFWHFIYCSSIYYSIKNR